MSSAPVTIKVDAAPGRLRIRLSRPAVRNAFDAAMIAELTAAFDAAARDATLRAVVVDGEGPVFCAGADAAWMRAAGAGDEAAGLADARRLAALFAAVDSIPCPVVVAARGAALGGGAGLVAAADVAIAEEGTKFGFTEVRLGIIPAVIGPFALRAIGPRAARRLFLTGEIFDAARARELGLVSEVVAAGRVDDAVDAVVARLLAAGPAAVREAKRLVKDLGGPVDPGTLDACARRIAALRRTPEAQEGLAAFLDKRDPSWVVRGA